MNTFVKTIQTDMMSLEFLKSLNGLMNLTDREIDLFSRLLNIQLELLKTKAKKQSVDSAEIRKRLIIETGITRDNLSRYMKIYRNKGLIVKNNGAYYINKALIPVLIGDKRVQITMILKLNDNE